MNRSPLSSLLATWGIGWASVARRTIASQSEIQIPDGSLVTAIWISDADAVILRSTIAQPIPQTVNRENRSEIYISLDSVQRIEVLHKE